MVVSLNTENWTSNPIHCPSTASVCVSESFDHTYKGSLSMKDMNNRIDYLCKLPQSMKIKVSCLATDQWPIL